MQADDVARKPRITVCLVDDESDITTLIRKGLEMEGFEVHEFNDSIKAWEYFRENGRNCTLVLSDIRMPGMNGFEFCRRVKALRPEVPVLLMTAFEINHSEFDKVMPKTKVNGFIRKPVPLKKLVAFIHEFMLKAE